MSRKDIGGLVFCQDSVRFCPGKKAGSRSERYSFFCVSDRKAAVSIRPSSVISYRSAD